MSTDIVPRTILLVDDDLSVIRTVGKRLQRFGHMVIPAVDGDDAVGCIGDFPEIDVVITDYDMPVKNGLDTIKAIRESRPELEIWLVSSGLPPGVADKAKELCVKRVFEKTHFTDNLIEAGLIDDRTIPRSKV